ncbi:MAG: DUF4296 domain-containing protein [Bacteroidota bacterium]|nr:DUF4296 domain-containing protein [Bacteroidota bacterium]
MIKIFIYIFISVCLFSCYSGDRAPANIIKPKEMKSILWDVMRAQTLARETSLKDSTIDEAAEIKLLSQKIFEIHQTDSTHFIESYNWYVRHPDVLKIIFDSLYSQKQRETDLKLKIKENFLGHPVKPLIK